MYIPSKLQQEQLSLRGRRVDQEVGATDTRRKTLPAKFFLVAYTLPSLITVPFSRVALQVLSPKGSTHVGKRRYVFCTPMADVFSSANRSAWSMLTSNRHTHASYGRTLLASLFVGDRTKHMRTTKKHPVCCHAHPPPTFPFNSATSDGGFFCGPGGVIFPLRRQSSTSSVSISGGSPTKPRNTGQLGASYSPGALGGAGAGAGSASPDAYSNCELCSEHRDLRF